MWIRRKTHERDERLLISYFQRCRELEAEIERLKLIIATERE